ncbi:AbrB/MazE/SpoVT family DNA-binding domain-containing protein [Rubrobacter marinus]|uniref:AbrB/MazE/SpoVT family DNA-binding domain-containing protein n=1 Tax=Rubrobacter marinus TaxID=2653852 RepID=A0A6G8PUE9_9ACTN|nr:AbrB/MazE/SpoVT family DNA-binding domain-containing protein [Rubrobacter marinus]QIN77857.1 AbrB/MazE/SpoVT family DNA-binding domain-containing protein [Rubrobacter marinus]
MRKAIMTSKGQLTVPKEVREQLGLEPGDGLVFELDEGAVRLRVEKRTPLRKLKGSLPAGRAYPGKEAERRAARAHVAREVAGEGPVGG